MSEDGVCGRTIKTFLESFVFVVCDNLIETVPVQDSLPEPLRLLVKQLVVELPQNSIVVSSRSKVVRVILMVGDLHDCRSSLHLDELPSRFAKQESE